MYTAKMLAELDRVLEISDELISDWPEPPAPEPDPFWVDYWQRFSQQSQVENTRYKDDIRAQSMCRGPVVMPAFPQGRTDEASR